MPAGKQFGEVMAYIPKRNGDGVNNQYRKVGVAFRDSTGRLSIKLDALPIPGNGWEGWLNIWTEDSAPRQKRPAAESDVPDDDIPF